MIWKAKEGEITWFPEFVAAELPENLPSGISIHLKKSSIGVEIQGLTGAIPLLNGDTLQILPKIGTINFLRLLFKVEGYQGDLLREYEEFVEYSLGEDESVESIVVRQLMISASEIISKSPIQGRVNQRKHGFFAAGQIEPVATALNLARRQAPAVVYQSKERTRDVPENRVITEALVRGWALLEEKDRNSFANVFENWIKRFPRAFDLPADLIHVEKNFAVNRYGGVRDYYRKALMLAQIILGTQGLGFNEAATVNADSILLNTADVFEKYLRSVISEAYRQQGYIVSKGNVGVTSLYTNGSFELNPDISIFKNGRTILIADAKYKIPTPSDHYQMNVYLNSNNVTSGILLAPLFEGKQVIVREFCTFNSTIVREVYLPMSDLAATEEFLGTLVEKFA